MRKEIGDEWLSSLLSNRGRMDRPTRIKHICSWLEGRHRAPETMSNSLITAPINNAACVVFFFRLDAGRVFHNV
jgi:hypothetical protein